MVGRGSRRWYFSLGSYLVRSLADLRRSAKGDQAGVVVFWKRCVLGSNKATRAGR